MRVLSEKLTKSHLIYVTELAAKADTAEIFVNFGIEFERLGMQVHLSIEEVEHRKLQILEPFPFEIVDLGSFCWRLLRKLDGFLERFHAFG